MVSKLEPFKEDIISSYLSGNSSCVICKLYNVTPNAIIAFLRKNDILPRTLSIANRKYPINESYFDNIDTPEKAYFVGLLYADGCNSTENHTIRLGLLLTDSKLLEKLSSLIYHNYRPLKICKAHIRNFPNGKSYISRESCILTMQNQHISGRLSELGVVKAKTTKLVFPAWLSDELLPHFIRGYFDGDGSICLTNGQISIGILSTKSFCDTMCDKVNTLLGIRSSVCSAGQNKNAYQYIIHGNKSGIKFMNWLYTNSTIELDRKHEKYNTILHELGRD